MTMHCHGGASYVRIDALLDHYNIVLSLIDNGHSKPCPRTKSRDQYLSEPEENLCLLRASNGKKKISTVVRL